MQAAFRAESTTVISPRLQRSRGFRGYISSGTRDALHPGQADDGVSAARRGRATKCRLRFAPAPEAPKGYGIPADGNKKTAIPGLWGGSRVDESVLVKGIDKVGRVRVSEQGLRLSESVKSAFKCWI